MNTMTLHNPETKQTVTTCDLKTARLLISQGWKPVEAKYTVSGSGVAKK